MYKSESPEKRGVECVFPLVFIQSRVRHGVASPSGGRTSYHGDQLLITLITMEELYSSNKVDVFLGFISSS